MNEKLLFWITSFLPLREINDGGVPYLERYYLFTILGWRFYIHRFVGSDPDRGLHDHPWARAYSFILNGWYWEQTRSGIRPVRWFNTLVGDNFHRVVLPQRKTPYYEYIQGRKTIVGYLDTLQYQPCWTLFIHKVGDVKPWGFLRPETFKNGIPCRTCRQIFEPYEYTREGSQKNWWLTAPRRAK